MKPVQRTSQLFRDYAGDLQSQDITRLFSRDAARAYSVLTREQQSTEEQGLFHRIKTLFLGFSFHLGPARRILFSLTILLTILGSVQFRLDLIPLLPPIGSSPTFHLTSDLGFDLPPGFGAGGSSQDSR